MSDTTVAILVLPIMVAVILVRNVPGSIARA